MLFFCEKLNTYTTEPQKSNTCYRVVQSIKQGQLPGLQNFFARTQTHPFIYIPSMSALGYTGRDGCPQKPYRHHILKYYLPLKEDVYPSYL